MFDRAANAALTPLLQAGARTLVRLGVGADTVSVVGFAIGIAAAAAIAAQAYLLGLALILVSRLADGLDGAVARLTNHATDRGAFLDITLDFVFYASIPLAFAFADPSANALAAAALLAAFIGTGSSFLAYAVLAERRGLPASVAYPHKGLYYLGGLTEAGETLVCFALMCLWPQHFALFAFGFALLCGLTTIGRIVAGARAFKGEQRR
jgi:phosphatidylglycerophosphate synthase